MILKTEVIKSFLGSLQLFYIFTEIYEEKM